MGVHKVFNPTDLMFTEFTFASLVTQEEPKTYNYAYFKFSSSFLLDTNSFILIIFKRLYHTNFKLSIVNFARALPPGPPLNPTEN